MSLTIEPTGGLANRLRALDAALALARVTETPLSLLWQVNRDLGGAFQRFFELPVEVAALENVVERSRQPVGARLLSAGRRRLYRFLDDARIKALVGAGADFAALVRSPRPLYVRTCFRFLANPCPYDWLRPVERLRSSIDAQAASFGEHTIGVHVRRTDHSVARERSPDALFFEALDQAIARDEASEFFLCSDDPEVLRRFRERYGPRVLSREARRFGRDSAAAIDDAVIDVFCLARTRRIVGSEWSSFSRLAAQVGGIERRVLATGETRDTPALWGPLV